MVQVKKNILMTTGAYEMTSGAAHFVVDLIKWLEANSNYHVIALLEKDGSLFTELKKNKIESYIIPQKELWCRKKNEKRVIIVDCFKNILRKLVVCYGYFKLNLLMSRKQIRLVHINGLTRGMAAKSAYRHGIPYVWHIHEFMEEDLGLEFTDREKIIETVNYAKKVIAVSEAVRSKFIPMFGCEIEVIHNCFHGFKNNRADKWYATDIFKICIVGRVRKTKGQYELVKAISLLQREDLDKVELSILGSIFEPEYKKEIDDLIRACHIENKVVFEGYVSDISNIYMDAHCICVCSEMEAFGRTTIEGMLNHCVLIGANTGGTAELINDKITGLLYEKNNPKDLSEKISYCINHIPECKKMAFNAFEYASSGFDMDVEYKRFIEIYDDLVG